jgi:hypothetical protein
VPLVHGWCHQNNAPKSEKKSEFGQFRPDALAQTSEGLHRLRTLFGTDLFEMFVPPWNRIDDRIIEGLARQGYCALSAYTPRTTRQVAGLVQINTHIDPIFWRGGGGLVDPDQIEAMVVKLLRDRRSKVTDRAEPLGFLTHHLVHDAAIWDFTERLLGLLLEGGAVACNLSKMKELP